MQLPVAFQKSLEAGIAKRLAQSQCFELQPPADEIGLIDFGSNNTLSLRSCKLYWEAFLCALERTTSVFLGAGGSRVLDGSNAQIQRLERLLAEYHGAEDTLFFNSGYEANMAIYGTLPRPGDVIVHDAMIHASIRDGIRFGRCSDTHEFPHNDADELREILEEVVQRNSGIRDGRHTAFVAIESFYSMEGDAAPVNEILTVMENTLPTRNGVLIVDEAHSTGLIGPGGSGFIQHLGYKDTCVIQMQSYGKAPGALGGVVLCNPLIKHYLTNYSRGLMYSTGPSYPTIAMIEASITTMKGPEGERRRHQLRANTRLFHQLTLRHSDRRRVVTAGVLRIPSVEAEKEENLDVPIIPLITRLGECTVLQQRLKENGFRTHAVRYPAVPRNAERVRFMMHAHNTAAQIRRFVDVLFQWAVERLDSEAPPALSHPEIRCQLDG